MSEHSHDEDKERALHKAWMFCYDNYFRTDRTLLTNIESDSRWSDYLRARDAWLACVLTNSLYSYRDAQ